MKDLLIDVMDAVTVDDDCVVDSECRENGKELIITLICESGIVRVCYCYFEPVSSPLFVASTVGVSGKKINLYCVDVDEYVPC